MSARGLTSVAYIVLAVLVLGAAYALVLDGWSHKVLLVMASACVAASWWCAASARQREQ